MKFFKRTSSSTISFERSVCGLERHVNAGSSELFLTKSSTLPAKSTLTKSKSSSNISQASTVSIDSVGSTVPCVEHERIYDAFERLFPDGSKTRLMIMHTKYQPAALMDDFVDFVGHHIIEIMNEISRYVNAFNYTALNFEDNRVVKKETTFCSVIELNILPKFLRTAELINKYSRTIACDLGERYALCREILDKEKEAQKLIKDLRNFDEFSETVKKEKHFRYEFEGPEESDEKLPQRIRDQFSKYEGVHKCIGIWFNRIPLSRT